MKSRKFLFLLLAVGLWVGLASCGMRETEQLNDTVTYMPEFIPVSTNFTQLDDWCISEDAIYIRCRAGYGRDFAPAILRVSTDNGRTELLSEYQPPEPGANDSDTGFQYSTIVCSLQAGSDGTFWESSQLIVYHIEGRDYWEKNIPVLRHLDKDGRELSRLDFPADLEEKLGLGYLRKFIVDGDGAIFAQCDNGIALLENTGSCVFSLVPDGADLLLNGTVAVLGNGKIGVLFTEYDFVEESYINTLRTIDKETQDWGSSFRLGGFTLAEVFSGDETALFYYRTGDTLCAWREGAEESEQVVNLLDVDIDSAYLYAAAQSGEQFVLLVAFGHSENPNDVQAVKLRPARTAQKKTLTFATIGLSSRLRRQILEFNQNSSEYRISVKDYSQYGGHNAALTRLITEVGAGEIPDLLATSNLPVSQWAAKGLLEDLNPYLDSDSVVNRDMLMERVLKASEINGKLYEISPSFWISTLMGAKNTVGDRMTWTAQEMNAALETMPDDCIPFPYGDKTDLLNAMIIWPRLVDWENGVCHFESEEFRSLLEFCANMPDCTVQNGYNENKAIFDRQQMLISHAVLGFGFLVQAEALLGGDIAYIGYPNAWGEVGSRFYLTEGVAMSSGCKEKEAAWSFLRTLLLPQSERLDVSGVFGGFPVNAADFARMAEAVIEKPGYIANGDGEVPVDPDEEKTLYPEISIRIDDSTRINVPYSLTQDNYDRLMNLYNAITNCSNRTDKNLSTIVAAEASAYFAGDRTLEKTIEMIQNRASLYINEQS